MIEVKSWSDSKLSAAEMARLGVATPDHVATSNDVCRRLKAMESIRDIPVLFVTALSETTNEESGFEAGCVDYLTKPINPSLALARVKTHLALCEARLELQEWNSNLKRKVINNAGMIREKHQELHDLLKTTGVIPTVVLSRLLEMTGFDHYSHSENVSKLVIEAAKEMPLDYASINDLSLAALLHDVGKSGLPGPVNRVQALELADGELGSYRQHPVRSQSVLHDIESLHQVAALIRHHHEAYDGSGFPDSLKGEAIPLGAQLIAIADFIDHSARTASGDKAEFAVKNISEHAGTLFNPKLLHYFEKAARTLYSAGGVEPPLPG